MTLTAVYSDDFSRVLLEATNMPGNVSHAVIDRSVDGIHWTVVRGGSDLEPRLTGDSAPLNPNTGFETDTAGWFGFRAALTRSTAQAHPPSVASGFVEPDGTGTADIGQTDVAAVTPGETYTWSAWIFSPAGFGQMTLAIQWKDAGGATVADIEYDVVAVPAGVWTQLTATDVAPALAVTVTPKVRIKTPATTDTFYVDDAELTTPVGNVKLDDYEFTADVENTYRATYYDDAEVQVGSPDTVAITPVIDSVWLKSVARPFLNMRLRNCGVADGQISRRGRGGVFDVIGRTNPVAVSDVRSAIEFTLRGATLTFDEAQALDYLLMSGDILFIQAPSTSRVPTIHAFCGDSSRQLKGTRTSEISAWLLPMSEVAKPGAFIIGVLATYRTVLNRYAIYADLLAAESSYASLLDLVADPSEVLIP